MLLNKIYLHVHEANIIMELTFLNTLKKWFNKFERYKVTYKNGSYHLANLFQSPQTIIESFDKMPFCKHDRDRKRQISETIFIKSTMFYFNPEEELWVLVSNLKFKKNVLMKNLYDKELPLEYHFINIHIKDKTIVNKSLVNGLALKNRTWSMFKAGEAISEYHFKNSNEKNITIFFTTKWLEKQIIKNPKYKANRLKDFFDSSNSYLILDEEDPHYDNIFEHTMNLVEGNKNDIHINELKDQTYLVLTKFINKLNTEIISENHFGLNDTDRKNIQQAEAFLLNNLMSSFPGIEKVALKVGISPSKLKMDFKSYHNKSIYQYYSEHQMKLAYELINRNTHTVREIATMFGYENSSKFSARFKSIYKISPSELNN
jgi:AraC-like DNA-binding protein